MRSFFCLTLALLLSFGNLLTVPAAAAAGGGGGSVTDTLTIKVGYWGMEEKDYVEKATYHWTELDDQWGGMLETHQQAYSFFRESDEGGYKTVIDSARGFYIKDLLTVAGINLNDIEGVSFYTQDQSVGYFTRFSYEELFAARRYFFNDLSYFVHQETNERGEPTGEYSIDQAVWDGAVEVEPMLALEDGWLDYEPGTEHTAPVYEGLSTGNRFRLLFGQRTPEESRTNQTAKYTHSLYIALNGTPKITTDDVELDSQIGSEHTLEFTMATSDDSFNEALKQFLEWSSSNEEVLEITGTEIEDDDQYEDQVKVKIRYIVKSPGTASISGNFFGANVRMTDRNGQLVSEIKMKESGSGDSDNPSGDQNEKDQDGEEEKTEDEGSSEDSGSGSSDESRNDSGNTGNETSGSAGVTEDQSVSGGSASDIGSASQSGSGRVSATSSAAGNARNTDLHSGSAEQQTEDGSAEQRKEAEAEKKISEEDTAERAADAGGRKVYELSDEIGRMLGSAASGAEATGQIPDPGYDTLEVKKSEEDPVYRWMILISVILLMTAGAVIGFVRYLKDTGMIRGWRRGRIHYV